MRLSTISPTLMITSSSTISYTSAKIIDRLARGTDHSIWFQPMLGRGTGKIRLATVTMPSVLFLALFVSPLVTSLAHGIAKTSFCTPAMSLSLSLRIRSMTYSTTKRSKPYSSIFTLQGWSYTKISTTSSTESQASTRSHTGRSRTQSARRTKKMISFSCEYTAVRTSISAWTNSGLGASSPLLRSFLFKKTGK